MTVTKPYDKIIFLLAVLLYTFWGVYSANFCYFWDCIELVSKQAHWFYLYSMNPLSIPVINTEFPMLSTIAHPPLVPYMTAVLWKIFGQHLWVSHLFTLFWAYIFIYNLWRLTEFLFEKTSLRNWVFVLVLSEATVLTQFVIASPDFILITGFIISLRAILQQKKSLLAVGLIFLCCVSVRGVFVGAVLFLGNIFYQYKLTKWKNKTVIFKTITPYIPVVLILGIYFGYYIFVREWRFWEVGHSSNTYTIHSDFVAILKHFAELGIRVLENGRFFLYLAVVFLLVKVLKKRKPDVIVQTLILIFVLLCGLYLFFAGFTKMPFLGRYFMPHYILVTLISFLLIKELNFNHIKINIIAVIVLILQITGNFWIYPDKIIKVWDGTLAHIPFYELRKSCFDYIDENNLNYQDISGGFCLFDDRGFVELSDYGKVVNNDFSTKYYLYSNISTFTDQQIDDFADTEKWKEVKTFKKGCVYIKLLENQTHPIP